MPNFFQDNADILFLFDHLDLAGIAALQEDGFTRTDEPGNEYAPVDAGDAIDNYRRILTLVGDVAGNQIAPRAEQVDREGNTLNADGTVTLGDGVRANLKALAQADLMGFTLPRRFGGLHCPNIVYTMAIEMVSRADASLMNIFGLQGIAETINAFATEEVKQEYLPRFAHGEVTGAMALTEPDAGSDLQAVALRAWQDTDGQWRLTGVKRFITNGCGDVLLTLARSEPDVKDGRGLSLLVNERGPRLKVRHLEHKLGIHGSPTCELVYDDVPAKLVGQRQLGLISYTMSLMNGARIGIAAQSLGIAEAAFRVAREYAHTRKQFGVPIERLPAVAEMVADMKIAIEAARVLTYESSMSCDHENNTLRVLEFNPPADADEAKRRKNEARVLKRLNGMLTPMSKYYASEMCVRVANDAIQVLGGSGYMSDYPVERHLRDSRITTIYEGTSQLQVVAAVRGVCGGAFEKLLAEYEEREYTDASLNGLKHTLSEGKDLILGGVKYVKERGGQYMDLVGRKLVDSAVAVIIGHLFLRQAAHPIADCGSSLRSRPSFARRLVLRSVLLRRGASGLREGGSCFGGVGLRIADSASASASATAAAERKRAVARRFIETSAPAIRRDIALVCSGDESATQQFELLAGPPTP